MSKLIERLKQVSQSSPKPMGFRAAQPSSEKPKILLIAGLTQPGVERLPDYLDGADAAVLYVSDLNDSVNTVQTLCQTVPDIPWGVWFRNMKWNNMEQLTKYECDFLIFPAAVTPLTAIKNNTMVGSILEIDASIDDGLLRAVDNLPVDAILIADEPAEKHFLTWHNLMLFQHFATCLVKPILALVPQDITANELSLLWGAGIGGVIISTGAGLPKGRLGELRQTIDKLTFPPRRKAGKAEALLPFTSRETGTTAEEEEEEEE